MISDRKRRAARSRAEPAPCVSQEEIARTSPQHCQANSLPFGGFSFVLLFLGRSRIAEYASPLVREQCRMAMDGTDTHPMLINWADIANAAYISLHAETADARAKHLRHYRRLVVRKRKFAIRVLATIMLVFSAIMDLAGFAQLRTRLIAVAMAVAAIWA
jgi:hypothetical protein